MKKICFGVDATLLYNIVPTQKVKSMDNKYIQVFGVGAFIRYVIQ
jgi:type I site-specific restriction endonuclease